jgi:chromosome segregation protein
VAGGRRARCAAGPPGGAGGEESFAAEERELEALQAASHEAEARAEHARRASEERRAEARVELARAIERRAGAGRRRESAERTLADGDRNLGLARTELGNCRARLEECARTAAAGRAEAERARERRERAIGDLALAREEARAAAEALEEARRGAAVLEGESRACRESLEEYRLRESESRMRLEGLVDRMREEARVDLAALHAERAAPPAAPPAPAAEAPAGECPGGEASPAGLDLSVFDPPDGDPPPAADAPPPAPPAPFDPEAAEREIQEIRLKIDRMGAVNLEALDQLGGVEKETGDLRTQEKDLARAREELLEALRLLNRQSRERFLETFEAIRGHFNETFRRLFGGGKADVYLDEGEDVLEAGVEVVARPPGKELRSISLLSGGERAMTAVALLFAVYRARPSPFCVLDEVDAPLDESNVGRFAAMVREFTDGSQFIVITHNKRTMSTCDRLYGISMAEPGVSSRVLLELERVAEGEGASAAVEAA